jgi:hypothetical protein
MKPAFEGVGSVPVESVVATARSKRGVYLPGGVRDDFNALNGAGNFASIAPDAVLWISNSRFLLFLVPAEHVNKTSI